MLQFKRPQPREREDYNLQHNAYFPRLLLLVYGEMYMLPSSEGAIIYKLGDGYALEYSNGYMLIWGTGWDYVKELKPESKFLSTQIVKKGSEIETNPERRRMLITCFEKMYYDEHKPKNKPSCTLFVQTLGGIVYWLLSWAGGLTHVEVCYNPTLKRFKLTTEDVSSVIPKESALNLMKSWKELATERVVVPNGFYNRILNDIKRG